MKMYGFNFYNKLTKWYTVYIGKDLSCYCNFENNIICTLN